MAQLQRVTYSNASPRGTGDNRLNSIPAKAKHVNDLITHIGDNCSSWRTVTNTTAFVQDSDSIVTLTQPANSVINSITLVFTVAPTTAASADLGYEVGTTAGGGEVITKHTDNIIDAGADGTDMAAGAVVRVPLAEYQKTLDDTTLAADTTFTTTARTLHCNTVCTDHSVTIPGTVFWAIEFVNFK